MQTFSDCTYTSSCFFCVRHCADQKWQNQSIIMALFSLKNCHLRLIGLETHLINEVLTKPPEDDLTSEIRLERH